MKMYKVGLTGGIGSGKTTVARVFESLGIPVYYADQQAKLLMHRDDVAGKVREVFGDEAYTAEGLLNREYIAKIAFADPEKLHKLNSVVHPAVGRDFLRWAQEQAADYVIEEAAVLIESGAGRAMDAIIVVTAPQDKRIQRVMSRDRVARESVESRIAAQISDKERESYADYLIVADDERLLLPQIVAIDNEIRKKVLSLHAK